jgi:hypothetical protein
MKIQRKFWTVLIVVGAMFLCGCTGSGPEETTTTSMEVGETTTTMAPSGGISLEDIFNLGKPSGYSVAYDISTSSGGETERMTQTHYMSGEKFRFDMTSTFEGQTTEMRFYSIQDGTYICTEIQGIWNCIGGQTQEEVEYGFDMEDMTSEIESDVNKPAYDGTQVVAGVTAQCFRVTVSEGDIRYCVHPTYYIPLLMESKGTVEGDEGYFRMIATSITTQAPSDSVFELPAEPMDLNAMCREACMNMPAEYREDCLANC